MPENNGAEPGQCNDDAVGSGGFLNYTVGHEKRVEALVVEAYKRLPEAVESLRAEGVVIPKYVIDCIEDPDYEHDLRIAAGNHDWHKGNWEIDLLCGERRPTCREWLEEIYPHPELSAQHMREREGLEQRLRITGRALQMLRCHHMRHDGENLFYDGERLWYKGEEIRMCMEWESAFFYSPGPDITWHMNQIMKDGKLVRHMGYGPEDCYLLTGENLEFGAEIVKAMDAFDSMTSGRKHRHDRSYEDGLMELEDKAGTEFHPLVVRAFRLIPKEVVLEIMRMKAFKKDD